MSRFIRDWMNWRKQRDIFNSNRENGVLSAQEVQGRRKERMEKDLTTGSVLKNIVFFSLPYLLSYFLQTLYGMADLFIIGQFNGVDRITAVSVGSQVMHMLTVMIVGLAMGATVTIGKAIGGKKLYQKPLFI